MSILLDISFKYEIIYLAKEKSLIASVTLITKLLLVWYEGNDGCRVAACGALISFEMLTNDLTGHIAFLWLW